VTTDTTPAIPVETPAASAPPAGRRNPWSAAALTFVAPGVGHVYAGRPLRGIVAWALAFVFSLAMLVASMAADSPGARVLALALVPLGIVGLLADAAWTARRADPAAPRRRYQRKAVYAALIVASGLATQLVLLPFLLSYWRAFTLRSPNMAPTLLAGDYVMTERGTPPLRRGLVVTRMTNEGYESVNRIAAVPGDTVAMRRGRLWVNGREEPAAGRIAAIDDGWQADGGFDWQRDHLAGDTAGYAPTAADGGPLVVPPGHVFALGDNRAGSLDSRHLGFIPVEGLTGRVDWIYFSREAITREIRWHRMGREVR
jgi:signal peptidase I